MKKVITIAFLGFTSLFYSQVDTRIYDIVDKVSAERLEYNVQNLVDFGTRNTFSEQKAILAVSAQLDDGSRKNLKVFQKTVVNVLLFSIKVKPLHQKWEIEFLKLQK